MNPSIQEYIRPGRRAHLVGVGGVYILQRAGAKKAANA